MAEAIETTQQIVLSVRMRGDEQGPQTGDVVLGGNIFGDFKETESYDKNEAVIKDGVIYRSLDDVYPGEWNPDQWESLTDITMRIGDFQANHAYKEKEVIQHEGHLFRAPTNFTTGTDFEYTEWEPIDSVNTILNSFEAKSDYSQYEIVAYQGKLYRAKNQFISGNTFDYSDWELIGDLIINDFQPSTNYTKGNLVISGGRLYRANQDFTSGTVFQPEYWDTVNSTGVGGFSSNTYYPKGSVIYVDGKLYVAKDDFTSVSAFDTADWEAASETKAESFAPTTAYQKDQIIYHNGNLYRALTDFVSTATFDADDWELISTSTTASFEPNTHYLKGTIIFQDGILWIAKRDFTSGSTFNPADWDPLTLTEQETYASWMSTGTTVNVDDLDEKFVNDSNADIYTWQSVDSATAFHEVSNTNAKARLQANSGEARLVLSDDDSQTIITDETLNLTKGGDYFRVDVDQKTVTMSPDIANALASGVATMSTTQKGVAKCDGASTRVTTDVLTAYPLPDIYTSGHVYKQYELCTYNNQVWSAKAEFTAATWNVSQWYPVHKTVGTYAANNAYTVGDLVSVANSTHNDLYMCIADISSAPASMVNTDWYKIELGGSQLYLDSYGHKVLNSTNAQDAYDEIDTQEYTNVRPLDNTTRYRITVQAAGSTPPAATTGVTKICFYTE